MERMRTGPCGQYESAQLRLMVAIQDENADRPMRVLRLGSTEYAESDDLRVLTSTIVIGRGSALLGQSVIRLICLYTMSTRQIGS